MAVQNEFFVSGVGVSFLLLCQVSWNRQAGSDLTGSEYLPDWFSKVWMAFKERGGGKRRGKPLLEIAVYTRH